MGFTEFELEVIQSKKRDELLRVATAGWAERIKKDIERQLRADNFVMGDDWLVKEAASLIAAVDRFVEAEG